MPKNTVAVYTAIFGGKDGLLPQKKIPGVDFICFTDAPVRVSPWDVRVVSSNNTDPNRCAKEFKILPHRFLDGYDVSIWIDGNYLIVGDVGEIIETFLRTDGMAVFDHNKTEGDARNCIYREYDSIMELGKSTGSYKDDPEIMRKQIERYRAEGYPEENGLLFASILIRRHGRPDVRNAMEAWWREIETGSRRDQLSFNYIAWKTGLKFTVIPFNIRFNRWFYQIGIHRSSYRMKIFRYRLKRLFGLIRHR